MKRASIALAIGLTVLGEAAEAQTITAQQAMDMKNSEISLYLIGVGHGLSWANAILQNRKQPLIYCEPGNFAMVGQQYVGMLETFLKKRPDLKPEPAAVVMMMALQDVFPCK